MRRALGIAVLLALAAAAPAAADDATRMPGMDAANTRAVPDSPLRPPLKLRWQVDTGGSPWSVLVSEGRVINLVSPPGGGSSLTSRSLATGESQWTYPIPYVPGSTVSVATESGRVLLAVAEPEAGLEVVRLRSLDITTGAVQWTRDFPAHQGLGGYRLVVDRGVVFFFTNDGSNDLHAVRITDGQELWTRDLGSGSGTPAVDAERVYYSIGGGNGALDRDTGEPVWQHPIPGTSGGGGIDVMVHAGRMYADWGRIHDTSSGEVLETWNGCCALTLAGDGGIDFRNEAARAFGPAYGTTRWTNGYYNPSFIVGDHAYGGGGGNSDYVVHAIRMSDGTPAWCMQMQAPPARTSGYGVDAAYPVAAGGGALVVRVGDTLAALESGGSGSHNCDPLPGGAFVPVPGSTNAPGGGGSGGGGLNFPSPPAGGGPAIALTPGKRNMLLGQRTNLAGRLSGVAITSGTRVVIELDEFPYDDRWTRSGEGAVQPDGTFAFKYTPRRNARLRARAGDLSSTPVEVLADFPYTLRAIGRRSARPRVRWTIFAFRRAQIRQRRTHAYLLSGRPLAWRRVDSRRWQRVRSNRVSVDLRYPRGSLGRRAKFFVCTREPAPDGFGRDHPVDPLCGQRVIARALFP